MLVRSRLASIFGIFIVVFASACSKSPTGDSSAPKDNSAAVTSPDARQVDPVKAALRSVDAWVKAQNENKLDGYLALYDAAAFQGIKRTSSGTAQTYDFKAWKEERTRMFGTGVAVAADGPSVTTWKQNPTLGDNVVEVRFTQRWKNPRYADHGPKVLRFKLANDTTKIVYEELVSSSAGWDDSTAAAAPATKFLRARPQSPDRNGVDACAYLGGFGFACLDALIAEKNPVIRRYMRRMSDADARIAFDQWQAKQPGGVPHAEFADQCADQGPCGKTEGKSDDGYACLTRAESAIQENNEKESKAAHERACTCGSERAQIPIMGGFLACQGKTPDRRGQNIPTAEANEIRACAECDAEKGPAACKSEIERLAKTDADLAKYIETVHMPRCTQP